MSRSEWIFLVVLIINTIIAIVYALWAILFRTKNEYEENRRLSHVIRAVCILICPVVGLCFFLAGMLVRWIFFRTEVDLEDVVFSKERVRSLSKADVEREKNIVPIQEALAVTDYTETRQLMLNVLKGDIDQSLASIALALDSQDSETSHYAASVLSKELNQFRFNVRKLQEEIDNEENDLERRYDCCVMQIEYMNQVLRQKIFTDVEQQSFVQQMTKTGEFLYESQKKAEEAEPDEDASQNAPKEREQPQAPQVWLQAEHYAIIALRLMEVQDFEQAEIWCSRLMEDYPNDLVSYKCRLRLLFTTEKNEQFVETLDALKKSGISIDSATLEMIRVFQ